VIAASLSSSALAIAGAMLALWLISLPLRNASIADVWWGPGIALAAVVAPAAHQRVPADAAAREAAARQRSSGAVSSGPGRAAAPARGGRR